MHNNTGGGEVRQTLSVCLAVISDGVCRLATVSAAAAVHAGPKQDPMHFISVVIQRLCL